jgi:hypothetical protein
MDEEELYSSVAREAAEDDAAAHSEDAANDETFAGSVASNNGSFATAPSTSSREGPTEGSEPKAKGGAWGTAGAGVAAVAGRHDTCFMPRTFSALPCKVFLPGVAKIGRAQEGCL